MTQFCALFLHIYALLVPQKGGGHGTMTPPLNTPLVLHNMFQHSGPFLFEAYVLLILKTYAIHII